MGDRVKALRRENDDLKRQLNELKKEFQSIKSKMAEQKDCHEAAATAVPNTQDVQFLSDSYDALVKAVDVKKCKNPKVLDKKRKIVWFEYDRKADDIYASFLYYTNEFDFVSNFSDLCESKRHSKTGKFDFKEGDRKFGWQGQHAVPLTLKYWPKFDQLTHCYTLFTVPHVGDTGKNEGKQEEVEVTPVSIAHDVRKWLSDNTVSVAVFAKEVINLSQDYVTKHWIKAAMWSQFPHGGQKKPNDDAGTSHSETSKKRKVFHKVETSCIAVHCAVSKDSNGLPSASMTERLAESMDLTKRQVIKMIKFSPFGLDIFMLFSSSSIHPAFIWWVFSPVLPFGFRTIAGWQKRENMYRDRTVRQLNHSE
ncbi:unnamed protein product [Porites lobata]|uniref:Uncharacterized protein n=1 Tax=Porites lobata TaxID=104759 RepID=A0ABN8QBE8_9CNID|nr:unnamed protein product [Porites lobata]